jgi:hypothetical protein
MTVHVGPYEFVNAKWLLERDGKINLTVPSLIETNTDDLAATLAAA